MEEDLSKWPTIAEAAQLSKKSIRTVERFITTQQVAVKKRPEPGKKPITVINPDDIRKIAAVILRPTVESANQPTRQHATVPAKMTSRHPDNATLRALERLRVPLATQKSFNKREAAIYLGWPQTEVKNEVKNGRIPTFRLSNGWLRIDREQLDLYYQSRQQMADLRNVGIEYAAQ